MFYKILAYPDSSKDVVVPPRKENGRYAIHTREPAQDNRANKAVVKLLAEFLGERAEKFRIIRGHTSPTKLIEYRERNIYLS